MASIPLLSLPQLAFENVFKHFEMSEELLLTQCSKKMKGIVGTQKKWEMSISTDKTHATVTLKRKYQPRVQWILCTERDTELTKVKEFKSREIEGTTWKVSETPGKWVSVPEEGRFSEDLLLVVETLRNIYQCPIEYISLEFKKPFDFEKLIIKSESLRKAKNIWVPGCFLSHSEMTFLLDNLVAEDLTFLGYPGKKFTYKKPLNFPSSIHFYHATWIDPNMFMNMTLTSRRVNLESACQISDQHLNHFLKNWLSSDNRNLENVSIERDLSCAITGLPCPPTDPFELSAILEGIPTIPGAKKRPGTSQYFNQYHEYENGVDIRREDGVLATVLLSKYSGLVFTVWNVPNPNLI